MAVTLTVPQLAQAVRVQVSGTEPVGEPYLTILARGLATATAEVEAYAENAPTDVQNEAVALYVGYILDRPSERAFALSGAQSILSRWHEPAVEAITA